MPFTPRLPRLTLFSGPNCSLCDVAKAELAKVRQSRPFKLDVINIQDQGQEKWKKKYAYWIPALHLEGKEIAKGRWGADIVISALSRWEAIHKQEVEMPSMSYFQDSRPDGWIPAGTYVRAWDTVLGVEESDYTGTGKKTSYCFNCGAPDHMVSSCPHPKDRVLISLSRQYYNYLNDNENPGHERIHIQAQWQKQRLEWLEDFEPGVIKSELLQEALDSDDFYLRRISLWGYPKGWYCAWDPRDTVKERILTDVNYKQLNDEDFFIFGDNVEMVPQGGLPNWSEVNEGVQSMGSPCESIIQPIRWARYPNTYFDTDILPVYDPSPDNLSTDKSASTQCTTNSTTFTLERQQLWNMVISGTIPLDTPLNDASPGDPPPQPPESPPPLPNDNSAEQHSFPTSTRTLESTALQTTFELDAIPNKSLDQNAISPQHPTPVKEGASWSIPVLPLVSPYGLLFSSITNMHPLHLISNTEICASHLHPHDEEEVDMDISDIE
ncbi:hypothetical protein AMATHDRAFT_74752 [Amanita thiersii Skay4041]|uniref:CCHC-type domain-containing protein n=1 Tax=Amanita thiersii Skay4041 TaxID=703135 RepID=A0A2A9NMC8_9AGAR|nr:hypothetical protein AMATHDRAFT_74752 [Amanita thiersii Skay4041]